MVTAVPQDQWRLLDVQDHDLRLTQLAHRSQTLPEHAQVADLQRRERELGDELITARTAAEDLAREVTRAENDVEVVRQRARRDQARLDTGQGTAKELQALQHELVSLAQRQSALEDIELEAMERLEAAQSTLGELQDQHARASAELAEAQARRDAALRELDDQAEQVRHARADAAAGVPADLLALYEKVREACGGIGAARLRARRCEGCRIELTAADLSRLRAAAPDAVLRCEECRRILVRTPESGL